MGVARAEERKGGEKMMKNREESRGQRSKVREKRTCGECRKGTEMEKGMKR